MAQPDDEPTSGSTSTSAGSTGPGRPSVRAERVAQVVTAFIELVAEQGLESTTLDAVSRRSGIGRSVIRHHVGNRADLIHTAFEVVSSRYDRRAAAAMGENPTVDDVVAYLFGADYLASSDLDDQAFNALLVEARRDPTLAAKIRATYENTIDTIAAAATRQRVDLTVDEARPLAYHVLCLAEFNVDMQRLGFEPAWATSAAETARHILLGVP